MVWTTCGAVDIVVTDCLSVIFQQGKSACRLIVDGVEQTEETEECGEDSSCIRGPYTEGINVAYFCHGVGELDSHSKEDDDGNDCDERKEYRNSSEEGEDEEGGKKNKKKSGKKGSKKKKGNKN